MYKKYIRVLLLSAIVVYGASCVNTKKAAYFVDAKELTITTVRAEDTLSPLIQKNDILSVVITSLNAEASAIFNQPTNISGSTVTNSGSTPTGSGYLVNSDGFIQLPILGKIKAAGFSSKEVKETITAILIDKKLLVDPIVSVRHLNYEVTVIGEVGKPSVISVPSEKISMLKALGLAGDITVFGKKENVMLIREVNGKRQVRRIDLNSANFLSSPYYYLQPNDVVYVETNANKVANSSALRQTLPIVLSGISIILIALDRIIR